MKAKLKKLLRSANQSFSLHLSQEYHAYNDFHYHPEIELLYVSEGTGVLLIGDKVEPVTSGDMFLLGENVPHLFRFEQYAYSNPIYKQGKIELPTQLMTLHFGADLWGDHFINLPENEYLKTVFRNAGHVQIFEGELRNMLGDMFYRLLNTQAHERMLLLMQMLALIGTDTKPVFLYPQAGKMAFNPTDETRLTRVYLHTLNNFQRAITLKEIAAIIYMCPNAFCRYFKSRTHQSYFDFLAGVRINHARKLLRETNYSMVIVSHECGFSNLSNFNRCFKNLTGQTPLACRKEYQKYFKV